jgi:hypothetical protein
MNALGFTILFATCVVVASVVWLYLVVILGQEFGLSSQEAA